MTRSAHLAVLLDALADYVRTYVVMTAAQTTAVVLWVAHTHTLDAFETTPFLALTSPEKRCGKSRLFDVLELVVARPWRTIMPSEAVLFRKIDKAAPTLLLDETDAIFNMKNGNTEPLRALLNAGNRRGTVVPRCVGPQQQLVDFNVFCAKTLAGIGSLPDTITDRSIVVRLERKRRDETAERFRRREALEVAEPIEQELASWAQDAVASLELARPAIPDALDDRAEEAWEPLLAIAELASDAWAERATTAAIQLARADDEQALGVLLLRDIRDVFLERVVDRLPSATLASLLGEIETSPWGDLWGKPLDARGLARRLKPFGVIPRTIRLDDGTTPKGYLHEQFADVSARYLSEIERHTATTRIDKPVAADLDPPHTTIEEQPDPAPANGCGGVADKPTQKPPRPLIGDGYAYWRFLVAALEADAITDAESDEQYALHKLVTAAAPPADGVSE
jgi:Protein of unknown function (DUF3631)